MLAGRYRLEDRVQASPDGSVWHAVDLTLDRQVTVRVMRPNHPFAAEVADAARRAVLIDDPRLVRVLDVGVEPDGVFIVTEFFAGESLSSVLRRAPLPADEVRRVVGEVGQALERAELRGLHHLRLRPDQVVIRPDGSVKVLGLGVEAAAQGMDVDPQVRSSRTDTVSLAALVYAGLTARWPLEEHADLDLAPRQGPDPVGVEVLAPDAPADLVELCAEMLDGYDQGPRSPGALVARLGAWDTAPRPRPQARQLPLRPQPDVVTPPVPASAPVFAPAPAATAPVAPPGIPPAAPPRIPPATAPAAPAPASRPAVPAAPAATGPAPAPFPVTDAPRELGPDETGTGLPTLLPYDPAEPVPTGNGRSPQHPPQAHPQAHSQPHPNGHPAGRQSGQPGIVPGVVPGVVPGSIPGGPPGQNGGGQNSTGQNGAAPRAATAAPARPVDPDPRTGRVPGPAGPHPITLGDGVRQPGPAGGDTLLPWPDAWPGTPGRRDEPNLGPFPLAPVTEAPSEKQSRGVILALVGVLVLVLVVAVWGLKGLVPDSSAFGPGPTFTPVPLKPSETAGAPAGNGQGGAVQAGARPQIKQIASFDPEGDNREHPETVDRAFDGDPDTAWKTEEYKSADLSGKGGVGLVIDLGTKSTVRSITVDTPRSGGKLELRTLGADEKLDKTVLAGSDITTDSTVLTPQGGSVVERYLVVWITEAPEVDPGTWRLDVSEISVR